MTAHGNRERDFAFMGWVKTQPCRLRELQDAAGRCGGASAWSEADHAGERAGWRRAEDDTCIPLCQRHHADRTGRRGYFAGRDWSWMRAWCDAAIAETRAAHVRWMAISWF